MSELSGQDRDPETESARPRELRRRSGRPQHPRTVVPLHQGLETEDEMPTQEILALVESRPSGEYLQELLLERGLDDPALRLRELTEIERMRDLEIARLEQELAEKSDRIFDLETELFHARRRGEDLDRRWNVLARTYEENASALVEAGGRLEAIEQQVGYGMVLAVARALRRHPRVYRVVRGVGRNLTGGLR